MDVVQEIKDRLDIVEVISGYVKLEKAGVNWRALCPFHSEKTPSFFVSPERQIWHCFGGCQKGGDIFKFIMEIENVEFPEALRILAQRAGVELRPQDPRLRSEKEKLYQICEAAAKFFEGCLWQRSDANTRIHPNDANKALDYLHQRGLKDETIKEFRLGWAPNEWHCLEKYLQDKGYKLEDICKAGLIIKRTINSSQTTDYRLPPKGAIDSEQLAGDSYYDRFRSRIMFPLFDGNGRPIGFTGRIFDAGVGGRQSAVSSDSAKYVNTPETPIFNKGRIFYGYHKAKDFIKKAKYAVLVEGQMDFLMAWQDGVPNVLATSGTALTPDQLRILGRLAKNLILSFDMDEAGEKASERGIEMAQERDFRIRVLQLPEGNDLADFLKENPGKLKKLLQESKPIMDYYFERAFGKVLPFEGPSKEEENLDIREKRKIVEYILPKIKTLSHPIEQAHWIEKLANRLKIKEEYLAEELKILKAGRSKIPEEEPSFVNVWEGKSRKERLSERLLGLLFKKPDHLKILQAQTNYLDYFPQKQRKILEEFSLDSTPSDASVRSYLSYLALKTDFEFPNWEELDFEKEIQDNFRALREESIREELQKKSFEIKEAEACQDNEAIQRLTKEFQKLSEKLSEEQ